MAQSQFSDLTPNHKKALAGSIASLNFVATILCSILETKEVPDFLGTPSVDEIMAIAGSHFSDQLLAGLSVNQLVKDLDQQISQAKPGEAKIIKVEGRRNSSDKN